MTQSGHLAAKLGDGNRTTIRATMRRVAWWSIKIVCGAAAIYGTFIVAFSSLDLFFLLTGRVVPDFRQPSVVFVSTMLAIGMVLMIGGYKAPTWFGIDRSARPHRAKRISITRVVVLLLIVFGIFLVIAIPTYTHIPPSRQAGSYLYTMSSGWRKHVEEHARRTSSLVGSNFGLKSPVVEDAEFGRFEMSIDSNGTIKVRNTKFNLEALITPSLRESSVDWSCKETPAKDMTPWCR